MPSLNLDLDYFTHIKTLRMVSRLGKGSEIFPIRYGHIAENTMLAQENWKNTPTLK